MSSLTDRLSSVTGLLVFVHVCSCVLFRIAARRQRFLLTAATGLPLDGLALMPQLLRFKFFFPWVKPPDGLQVTSWLARSSFFVARASGFLALVWLCVVFPLALFFFVP